MNSATNNAGMTISIKHLIADAVGETEARTVTATGLGWVMGKAAAAKVGEAARAYGLRMTEVTTGTYRFAA